MKAAGWLFWCLCGMVAANGQSVLRQEDLRVTAEHAAPPEMLMNYLLRLAGEETASRVARLEQIRSESDFKIWQEANRRKFLQLIGGLPQSKGPLNPHVTGELARDGYSIRKLIFESVPGHYVTANLYVPASGQAPFPGILFPLGHDRTSKAFGEYQHLAVGLALRGYVVLAYDPQGQGERFQFWDYLTNSRRYQFRSNEHGLYGVQETLLGQNLARYLIWDGIRGLDYLTSLREVDASRLGVTGNSGGGALTTYIAMLDPRVKVAVPVTFICSIPKKIEARIDDAEADPEQDIPGLLGEGIDHTEEVGMIAPRPVLIGSATRDFFPIAGTHSTYAELQQLYAKLGVADRIQLAEFDHRHSYSQPLREAAYAWFDRWLKGAPAAAPEHEAPMTLEKESVLQSTSTGQVLTSLGGSTIFDFNRAETRRLEERLAGGRKSAEFGSRLAVAIRQRLALPAHPPAPKAEAPVEASAGDLTIEKLLLETEPGIVVPLRIISTKAATKTATGLRPVLIYLRDRGGEGDDPKLFDHIARGGRIVAVADVRGFGETMSAQHVGDTRIDYFHPRDAMDADFTYASFFLGKPLIGMRVEDALQVAAFLRSRSGVDPQRITLAGRGWAGTMAAFAGAVDSKISGVAIESPLISYAASAAAGQNAQPVSLMLPGVLLDFDFADVLASIAPRRLLILNPTNATARKMTGAEATEATQAVRERYGRVGSNSALTVDVNAYEPDIAAAIEAWILHG